MTELSQGVTASAATLFLPSHADIISNNLNVAGVGSGLQVGGSKTAYYIKVDDEIMKIVGSVSVVLDANAKDDDGAELTVLRAQKGTLATAHAAGATITVLGCMDGDETGNNCGGSCKPCSAPAKGGPVQQEKLLCVTPAGHSGAGAAGQGAGDLAVTVEASPGPKASPFRARMAPGATGWLDQASTAESCISEQNRGFQYGAHDFVWGVHFASAAQAEEVKVMLLEKVKANASAAKSLGSTLMTQCVVDFGAFGGETENPEADKPSEHDYQLHLLLGILAEASGSDNIPAAAGRIVLDVI